MCVYNALQWPPLNLTDVHLCPQSLTNPKLFLFILIASSDNNSNNLNKRNLFKSCQEIFIKSHQMVYDMCLWKFQSKFESKMLPM